MIRNHGMKGRDNHVILGFNYRMTEMEAAMGLVQLQKLEMLNAKRISNSKYLLKKAKELPWCIVPNSNALIGHTYFWCPLMVDESKSGKCFEDLKQHLNEKGIGFRQRYQEPLYKQEVLKNLGLDYSNAYLPNVEKIAGKILGLPNHPGLTQMELDRIVDALKSF